jgi:hypothetical protein
LRENKDYMKLRAPVSALLLAFSDSALATENPSAAIAPDDNQAAAKSIGVARMLADGTVLVGVPAPGGGGRAQAVLRLMPGDTQYQPLLDHIGGLKPGETKPIPPWPDPPAAPNTDGAPAAVPPGR